MGFLPYHGRAFGPRHLHMPGTPYASRLEYSIQKPECEPGAWSENLSVLFEVECVAMSM